MTTINRSSTAVLTRAIFTTFLTGFCSLNPVQNLSQLASINYDIAQQDRDDEEEEHILDGLQELDPETGPENELH